VREREERGRKRGEEGGRRRGKGDKERERHTGLIVDTSM
jgi:hypothetical protein